eukprot:COSAG04_NODE_10205_length_796_cov_1.233859_2_plen_35_part_01
MRVAVVFFCSLWLLLRPPMAEPAYEVEALLDSRTR